MCCGDYCLVVVVGWLDGSRVRCLYLITCSVYFMLGWFIGGCGWMLGLGALQCTGLKFGSWLSSVFG